MFKPTTLKLEFNELRSSLTSTILPIPGFELGTAGIAVKNTNLYITEEAVKITVIEFKTYRFENSILSFAVQFHSTDFECYSQWLYSSSSCAVSHIVGSSSS